ncbi:glycosyltransferase [Streptococcus equinus]|uniref:glycosyltransferase n=1 Tax=Streptococcus equinus TaxID=1335 RepID=UPI003EF02FF6
MNQLNKSYPLISVIVPVYKVEGYLEKCIESIISQTYSNLEIILVDDGSPDDCGKICNDYALKDKRIKVIHKTNGGLSSARNAGIDVATGEYLGFVDSDDTIEPFMYEKMMTAIKRDKTELAVCSVNYVFENGKKIAKSNLGVDTIFDFYDAMIEMNSHRIFDMGAWSKLYHKKLFFNLRFPVGKLSEDYYIMYKIFDRAQKVSYISTPCYNYLQRQNSITRNTNINHDHEYAAKTQMDYLCSKYPKLDTLGHTAYASAALTVYDSYLKNGVECSADNLEHFKKVIDENKEYINIADFLSISKKIQFKLFSFSIPLYNIVFKFYRKVKRI